MVQFRGWVLRTKAISFATLQQIQMALASIKEKNWMWKQGQAPTFGHVHGTPRSKDTRSLVSTCPRGSMCIATQPTKTKEITGDSTLDAGAITEVHWWDGERQHMTVGTMWALISVNSRTRLAMRRQWDGATMFNTHSTDGTWRRTMQTTSNGRDLQKKRKNMTELNITVFFSYLNKYVISYLELWTKYVINAN